jgi:hypothetical protein
VGSFLLLETGRQETQQETRDFPAGLLGCLERYLAEISLE